MTTAGRGIRNAFRNATRTVSIILILGLAIGLAFVMLTAHRSVSDKIASTLSSIGNTVNIGPPGYSAGGQLGKFLTTAELAPPGTLALATEGLACEPQPCTPPISFFTIYFAGSNQPTDAGNIGASTLSIVSGHPISGTTSAYDAMISTAMARKNGLKVGSAFTAYGKTFTVAAIFESDSQQGDDTVITSLP